MAGFIGSYNPEKLIVTIGGVIVSGFSDGSFVIARPNEDESFIKIGADGAISKAENANRSGEVEIVLQQTSKSNDLLNAIGKSIIPIVITDLSGRSLIAATKCWRKSRPEMEFAKEIKDRKWVFFASDLVFFYGGN